MAGMLINNLLYFNDIYCLSYILDYLIGNSIITTFLLIVCSYIFNFCTWHRLIIIAIQGNANAISQLASTLNCSIGQVQQAINGVMSQVQQVGNQVGQSSMQIINAIQAGNCNIAQQIASCCCENRLAICQQTNTLQQSINNVANGQERGFSTIAYETQRQTCDIRDAIRENTA